MINETTLTIHLSEEFKKQIKLNALLSNVTAKEYIIKLVQEDTERRKLNGRMVDRGRN